VPEQVRDLLAADRARDQRRQLRAHARQGREGREEREEDLRAHRWDAPAELDQYEALLGEPDPSIYAWAIGELPVPPEHDNEVMARLKHFAGNPRR